MTSRQTILFVGTKCCLAVAVAVYLAWLAAHCYIRVRQVIEADDEHLRVSAMCMFGTPLDCVVFCRQRTT